MASLSDDLVRKFQPTAHFRDFAPNNDKRINSMAISQNGQTLISASNYHVLDVYDCNRGTQTNVIHLRKYGCGVVDFVDNDNQNILISSKKRDHIIRPLNIETKSYGTYYVGHRDFLSSLCVHRSSGLFLSASMDKTVRLWDTRSPRGVSVATFDGSPVCAWDPSGVLFGVGVDSHQIQLFDIRGLDNGPFCSFVWNKEFNCEWNSLKFSSDGKQILISTNGTKLRVVDSIYGKIVHTFLSKFIFLRITYRNNKHTQYNFLIDLIRSKKFYRNSIGSDIQSRWRVHLLWQLGRCYVRLEQQNSGQSGRTELQLSRSHHTHSIQSEIFAVGNGQLECFILDFIHIAIEVSRNLQIISICSLNNCRQNNLFKHNPI